MLAVLAVLALAGCGSAGGSTAARSTTTPTSTGVAPTTAPKSQPPTTDRVMALLKQAGMPIDAWTVYTAETDTNHLLGRPNQYTARMSWHDTRIGAPLHPDALSVDDGGGAEIFANEQDLQTRTTYIEALAKQPLFAEYDYPVGQFTLLRVGKTLTPDQAVAYRAALASLAAS
jgi:hypothetical protein